MNEMNYKLLHASESYGSYGAFGIKIMVAAAPMPDLSSESIQDSAYESARLITAEVMAAVICTDEKAQQHAKTERQELLGLFPGKIFVETIPNGYCPKWCCRHLPWFIVTTEVGRFKIGWRKHVIHLEWTDTVGTKPAEELFPSENVSKYDKVIHAYGTDKARAYIETILANEDSKCKHEKYLATPYPRPRHCLECGLQMWDAGD